MDRVLKFVETSQFLKRMDKSLTSVDRFTIYYSLFIVISVIFYYLFGPSVIATLDHKSYMTGVVLVYSVILNYFVAYNFSDNKKYYSMQIVVCVVLSTYPVLVNGTYVYLYPIFGLLISLLFIRLLNIMSIVRIKNKTLPTAVMTTLSGLVAIALNMLVAVLINYVMRSYSIQILSGIDAVYQVLCSYPSIFVIVLMVCYLWSKGHHGANIAGKLMRVIWVPAAFANLVFFSITGNFVPFIGVETLLSTFVWIGGSGGTLGFAILLRFFSRSAELKEIGKTAFVPSIFNINESILFGVPVVGNKRYTVPFFVSPLLMVTLAYAAIYYGNVRFPALAISWILPSPVAAYVGSLFDVNAVILSIALVVASVFVYLPFMLAHDKELLRNERAAQLH